VLDSLSETAQKVLANLITLFLGLTIATKMQAEYFLTVETLLIIGLGLFAFIFDTAGGVLFAKLLNVFLPKDKKINPMIGAAGISAFPMSGRIVHKMGLEEDPQNFLLMHSIGVNVSGQIASVIAGGMILNFETILILGLGLFAFIFDTAGGVLFAKLLNLFLKKKINPMIGAAGISAFPMSGRIVHKMGLKEDPQNFLLMHSIGVNVSGQIASVIAGGLILSFFM
jgi:Na+-transporting methylmalonyl-CoA/oxaloacetate decarboxylase beta subunit